MAAGAAALREKGIEMTTDEAAAPGEGTVFTVRANRAFLGRAVRYLAVEAGVRQFLDIGTGETARSSLWSAVGCKR